MYRRCTRAGCTRAGYTAWATLPGATPPPYTAQTPPYTAQTPPDTAWNTAWTTAWTTVWATPPRLLPGLHRLGYTAWYTSVVHRRDVQEDHFWDQNLTS